MKLANKTPKSISEIETKPRISRRTLALSLILVLLTILTAYLYFTKFSTSPLSYQLNNLFHPESASTDAEASPAPTSSPKPLPTGKQVYNYSHGQDVMGPKPTIAIIDPIDPGQGDKQSFSVTIPQDNPPVTSVIATLITDNDQVQLKLKKAFGSKDTWTGTWKMQDSYNFNYRVHLTISDGVDTFEGALRFR